MRYPAALQARLDAPQSGTFSRFIFDVDVLRPSGSLVSLFRRYLWKLGDGRPDEALAANSEALAAWATMPASCQLGEALRARRIAADGALARARTELKAGRIETGYGLLREASRDWRTLPELDALIAETLPLVRRSSLGRARELGLTGEQLGALRYWWLALTTAPRDADIRSGVSTALRSAGARLATQSRPTLAAYLTLEADVVDGKPCPDPSALPAAIRDQLAAALSMTTLLELRQCEAGRRVEGPAEDALARALMSRAPRRITFVGSDALVRLVQGLARAKEPGATRALPAPTLHLRLDCESASVETADPVVESLSKEYKTGEQLRDNPEYQQLSVALEQLRRDHESAIAQAESAERQRDALSNAQGFDAASRRLGLTMTAGAQRIAVLGIESCIRDAVNKLARTPSTIAAPIMARWPYARETHRKRVSVRVSYSCLETRTGRILASSAIAKTGEATDTVTRHANPEIDVPADPLDLPSDEQMIRTSVQDCAIEFADAAIAMLVAQWSEQLRADADRLARLQDPLGAAESWMRAECVAARAAPEFSTSESPVLVALGLPDDEATIDAIAGWGRGLARAAVGKTPRLVRASSDVVLLRHGFEVGGWTLVDAGNLADGTVDLAIGDTLLRVADVPAAAFDSQESAVEALGAAGVPVRYVRRTGNILDGHRGGPAR